MESIDKILSELTLEEKPQLLTGGAALCTAAIERLNIPAVNVSDGPHGVRRLVGHPTCPQECNIDGGDTCMPTASAVGASWSREIAFRSGEVIADDCKQEDIQVILAPAANMKRAPYCGRNFEYYSEDPYLSGILAAEFINGAESKGVGTSFKHYAANNQEVRRGTINVEVDERTLMEYYLRVFEIALENSHPASVMCAYNKINGIWCSENRYLLTEILKEKWGYDGLVISDWGAVHNISKAVKAGLDLQMPRNKNIVDELREGIEKGFVTEEDIDRRVRTVLEFVEKYAKKPDEQPTEYSRQKQHQAAYEAACETITLLRNENNILPINKDKYKKIAVLGRCAERLLFMGGGSSTVTVEDKSIDRPLHCMRANAEGIKVDYFPMFEVGLNSHFRSEECLWNVAEGAYDCVVLFVGNDYINERYVKHCETEGEDRYPASFPDHMNEVIEKAIELYPNLVLVIQSGSAVIPKKWENAPCIIQMWYSGEAAGKAVADILFGKVNPSGKLSETFPLKPREDICYPGDMVKCEYTEKLNVGYRYYDAHPDEVWFPFGHGISYTEFEYSDITLSEKKFTTDTFSLEVSFKVKNIGEVAGKEAVQLYVKPLDSIVSRPEKELRAFDKVELQPGEEKTVTLKLKDKDFAYYNTCLHDWHVESGSYRIMVGASTADIRLTDTMYVRYDSDYTKDKFDGSMIL